MNCLPSHKFEAVPLYMHVEVDVCVPLPQVAGQGVNSLHDDQVGQDCVLHELCLILLCVLLPTNKKLKVYFQKKCICFNELFTFTQV